MVYKSDILIRMSKSSYIIGIDEVGRGPIAGPVTVGIVGVDMKSPAAKDLGKMVKHKLNGIRDSKQLTPAERENIHAAMLEYKKSEEIEFYTTSVNTSIIDEKGLSYSISNAIARLLRKFEADPVTVHIVLDGLLHAPEKFTNQFTVIKGDTIHLSIALASIAAKVVRDKYMRKQDRVFPEYGFKKHKGYGTVEHRKALKKYGLSPLHRKTFCKGIKKLRK